MKVLFMQTGGTVDKDYPKGAGARDWEINEPAAGRILEKADPSFEYRLQSVLRKDSLDMTDGDRQLIVDACLSAPEDNIVITHGTDTMRQTAEVLEGTGAAKKLIVLTGASRPERFGNSDASFNLGSAVGALNILKPGIYIAMSGRVLPWQHLSKDSETGQFSVKDPS